MSDMCTAKLKGPSGVYRRSDSWQELRSCSRSGISRAANGADINKMLVFKQKKKER